MYFLASLKYMLLFVCNRDIRLLASTLYLVEVMFTELLNRIDQLWEHQPITAVLTAFACLYPEWFVNTLHFIYIYKDILTPLVV